MKVDGIFTLLGSIVFLAIVTTLILPGRKTPAVLNSFFQGFSGSIKAGMGQ